MESDANLAQYESSNCTVVSRDESNDEIDEEDSDIKGKGQHYAD